MSKVIRNILVIICALSSPYASAVTANFTADVIAGCAPLVVNFTNASSGASRYVWDLGNSTPLLPITDASGTYLTAGTYTVTLTAYSGSSSSVHTMVITVYPLPTVNFTASDTAICPGTPITFTSSCVGGVPGIMRYTWNFGDGHGSLISSPPYTYTVPGYYNVTLSVTNAQACTKSFTIGRYIHVYTPPVIAFSAFPVHFCNPPGNTSFTSVVTGSGLLNYRWTFGDASPPSFATSPTHTYAATGSYGVGLRVTDGHECTDSVDIPNYIYVGEITARFTLPSTACVFAPVSFTNTSLSYTASSWNFGDFHTDTANSPTHVYSSPGTYTVRLVVSDGTCFDTVMHTITILPEPVGTFTITPTEPCPAPATLNFFSTVPSGASVSWEFGDGHSGSGGTTFHSYANNGADTVAMVITGTTGCKDTVRQPYNIYNLRTDINHDTIPKGCVPLTVWFTCHWWTTVPDSSSFHPYPFGISSFTWNFGDGSAPVTGGGVITHTYTATGIYYATVVVVTNNGCRDTAVLEVMVGRPPVASFTAAPTHICADGVVDFINTSIGADSYGWSFGDGHGSFTSDPVDTYRIPGVYSVTLVAYDRGCPDTFTRWNYIVVDSPKALILDSFVCAPRNRVYFRDTSLGDNSHLWLFGDGDTSSLRDPFHNYTALSTYTVSLATYNRASGCRDTAKQVINLVRPIPNFRADDTAICVHGVVTFTPHITEDSAISYLWLRNGIERDYTTAVYIDTFNVTGRYTITLIIKDRHRCLDTLKKTNYILVAMPVDSFMIAPQSGCWPLNAVFTDHSTDVTGAFFTSFTWAFGDGRTITVTTPVTTHTYTDVGTFGVREIVTDNIGCTDTVTLPDLVNVFRPVASFNANTLYPCIGYPDYFSNTSTGAVAALWFFGDGTSSTDWSATHVYSTAGTFTVRLVAYDAHGCSDTAIYVDYIHVTRPVASFYMDDSTSVCAPLSVNFFNTSTGAVRYSWTFGDGDISYDYSPGDLYIAPGLYPVQLVATNLYGCTDTAWGHVNIFGYAGAFTYTPLKGCVPLKVSFHAAISNVPSIIWDFDDGVISPASPVDSATHTYTLPGWYLPKLVMSDNTGCQSSSVGIDTIKVDKVIPGFTTSVPACLNQTFSLKDTSKSYWSLIDSWEWYYGPDSSNLEAPVYAFDTVGIYPISLKVTDAWGCTADVVENFKVSPPPVITVSPDTVICVGDKATLVAKGGVSYTWSPTATLSCSKCNPAKADPDVTTTYTVTGMDKNGCIGTDTVTVSLRTKTTSTLRGDTMVCFGQTIQLFDSGGTKYTWIPGSGLNDPNIADPKASPQGNTTYMVIAKLADCLPDTNYINIIVNPLPTVNAGPDQTLLAGSDASLHARGSLIDTLYWANASTLSCDTCYNPIATMSVTTTYVVNVATSFGCRSSDSVTIHLYCNSAQLFVPNAFTPNGDGQDDVFYPRGKGITTIRAFRIYNRWGQLLFERDNILLNDASNAWDGTYQGDLPHPDVYVYTIDALCETGEPVFVKGDVTIIR